MPVRPLFVAGRTIPLLESDQDHFGSWSLDLWRRANENRYEPSRQKRLS
jgi:hypothetical protein